MKMINNKYTAYLLAGILGILLLGSCKSKKLVTAGSFEKVQENREVSEVINSLNKNAVKYNTLSSKLAFNVGIKDKDEKNFSLPGSLKIVKDKEIQFSFQIPLLGMEVARISISPDSLVIIDRKDRSYLKEAIADIRSQFPFEFNYYNLQAMLTDQLFISGKSSVGSDDYQSFSVIHSEKGNSLSTTDNSGLIYTFYYDHLNHIQKLSVGKSSSDVYGNCSYNNFTNIDSENILPTQINMDFKGKDNKSISIDFSLSKINLNKDFSLDMNVPSNYNRITMDKVKGIVNSL